MGSKIPEIPAYFCCGMKPTEISKFLQSVLEQENERAAQGIELHIDQLKWRSQEIAMVTGWLELCPPIKVLRITHSFVHLERNAFLAKPFEQTEELELFNLGIQALQKGVFHGLGNLKILRMVGMEIKFIHPDVLQPCPGLNIVYLIKCINVKDFPNKMKLFAGKQSLDELNIVEMTNNRLEDMLDDNIFSSFVVIRAIFLAYNAITSIGPGTFAMHLATLKYLDLSHNNLKTLPSDFYGVFTTFGFLINLESNQWRCDCQLQELRELIVEKTYLFENLTIYCDDQQLIMEMPNLCLNESTTIKPFKPSEMFVTFGPFLPAPTTLPNFEATDPEKKTDTVDPQWGSGLDVNTAIIYCTTERSYNQPVAMRRKTSSLIVGRDVDGKYFLNVPKFSSGSIVIGFEDSNRENVRELSMISTCHTNKRKRNQDEVQFSLKLQPNKVHRFCLTKKSFALFSPFDCIAFYSHTNATNIPTNAWIMREDRRKVILICAIFGIFSIFIGIVLIYFILKLRLKLRKSKSERIRMQINSKMEHIRNHSYDSYVLFIGLIQ